MRSEAPIRRWLRPWPVRGLLALSLALSVSPAALAHRVYLYAWVEGGTVHTESYFGSNKKVRNGVVQVFDPAGAKLLEGRTDEQGRFSFPAPAADGLRIVVEAGMGHGAEYLLQADELVPAGRGVNAGTSRAEPSPPAESPAKPAPACDPSQLRAAVEAALDARLDPLLQELARCREPKRPGLTEALAGIGYIVGLMGLALYWKARRNSKQR